MLQIHKTIRWVCVFLLFYGEILGNGGLSTDLSSPLSGLGISGSQSSRDEQRRTAVVPEFTIMAPLELTVEGTSRVEGPIKAATIKAEFKGKVVVATPADTYELSGSSTGFTISLTPSFNMSSDSVSSQHHRTSAGFMVPSGHINFHQDVDLAGVINGNITVMGHVKAVHLSEWDKRQHICFGLSAAPFEAIQALLNFNYSTKSKKGYMPTGVNVAPDQHVVTSDTGFHLRLVMPLINRKLMDQDLKAIGNFLSGTRDSLIQGGMTEDEATALVENKEIQEIVADLRARGEELVPEKTPARARQKPPIQGLSATERKAWAKALGDAAAAEGSINPADKARFGAEFVKTVEARYKQLIQDKKLSHQEAWNAVVEEFAREYKREMQQPRVVNVSVAVVPCLVRVFLALATATAGYEATKHGDKKGGPKPGTRGAPPRSMAMGASPDPEPSGGDNRDKKGENPEAKKTQSQWDTSRHGVTRKIEREVRTADELDALKNPLEIEPIKLDPKGRPSQRYIGRKATVAINPESNTIVSVNPTSSKLVARLLRKNQ